MVSHLEQTKQTLYLERKVKYTIIVYTTTKILLFGR
jgi:hypothetical protein